MPWCRRSRSSEFKREVLLGAAPGIVAGGQTKLVSSCLRRPSSLKVRGLPVSGSNTVVPVRKPERLASGASCKSDCNRRNSKQSNGGTYEVFSVCLWLFGHGGLVPLSSAPPVQFSCHSARGNSRGLRNVHASNFVGDRTKLSRSCRANLFRIEHVCAPRVCFVCLREMVCGV